MTSLRNVLLLGAVMLLLSVPRWLLAYAPVLDREWVYPDRAALSSIRLLSPAGHAGAMLTGTGFEGLFQVYVVRADSAGSAVWTRLFGTAEQANGMILSADSAVIVVGQTNVNPTADYRLMRVTRAGVLQGNFDFGGNNTTDHGYAVIEHPAGWLYLAGESSTGGDAAMDMSLLRVSTDGAVEWGRTVPETHDARALSMPSDTVLFLYGTSDSTDARGHDFVVVRTDSSGLNAVVRRFESVYDDVLRDAIRISPDLTLLVGAVRATVTTDWDVVVIATNDAGDSLWSRSYGTPGNDMALALTPTFDRDAGVVLAGWVEETVHPRRHAMLLKLSLAGDSLWTWFPPDTVASEFADVVVDSLYRYHAAGRINNAVDHGFYCVTEPDPRSPGNHPPYPFSLISPADRDTLRERLVTLQWQASADADSADTLRYYVQVAADSLFSAPTVYGPLDRTRYEWMPATDDVRMFWRVAARDRSGLERLCRDPYHSLRLARPDSTRAFNLLFPDSGTVLTHPSSVFRWQRAFDPDVNDTIRYTLHFLTGDTSLVFPGLRDTFATVSFVNNPVIGQAAQVTWFVTVQSVYPPMTLESNQRWSFVSWSAGADDLPERPLSFALDTPYPNPFNSATRIRYTLDRTEDAVLEVFGIDGRLVATLSSGMHTAGLHEAVWDAGASGQGYASGMFMIRLRAGNRQLVTKALLVK